MPHRQNEAYERAVKGAGSDESSGKLPVSTVQTSAATPPASWRAPQVVAAPIVLPPPPNLLEIDVAAAIAHVLRFRAIPFYCLGLTDDASADAIRKQYKQLALRLHPDKCDGEHAREAFDAMAAAYQRIKGD